MRRSKRVQCRSIKTVAVFVAVLVAAITGGCTPEDESGGTASEWSFEHDALRFEEDLYVSEAEDFFIGSADDIAIAADGRIYVADGEAHHVKVLSPRGALVDVIGSQGEGPGEFSRVAQVDVARGDSLFVFDAARERMSVFAPDYEFVYSISMQGAVRPARSPMVRKDGSYLAVQSPLPIQVARRRETYQVRAVHADGVVGDTLFGAPSYRIAADADGVYFIPFTRDSHFLLGSDEYVHVASGDSLTVSVYNRRGALRETIAVPFDAVPVTDTDRKHALEGYPDHVRSVVEPEIPATKPAFTRFAMDDRGRYWFKRPTADPTVADWWIVDADNRRVLTGRAPASVDFAVIQNGFAYGTIEGGNELPAVVRYRILE